MPANYVLLERIELNAEAASVIFNNIPQSGYTDLKVVISARTNRNNSEVDLLNMTINGNNSALYSVKYFYATGTSTAAGSSVGATTQTGVALTDGNTATASTFGNTEVLIPNYLSSNPKIAMGDGVSETNAASGGFQWVGAGFFDNTSPVTSLTFFPDNSTGILANSTFSLYGLAALGTTPVIAPKASGGNITTDGTYWIHTFNSSGTFIPNQQLTCQYLVIAGGGAGNYDRASGGGAGGYRSSVTGESSGGGASAESPITLNAGTSNTVTVGAGGAEITAYSIKNNGSNSSFGSIISIGGGSGSGQGINANTGGSGGGAPSGIGNADQPGAGTANQGYAGGNPTVGGSQNKGASGGGGAGAVGGNGGTGTGAGGAGGNGVASSITGTSVTRAGGGGGGAAMDFPVPRTGGAGGSGGGGAGGNTNGAAGAAGTINTGGGGGGGANVPQGNGGAGGSGIVIIRYAMA